MHRRISHYLSLLVLLIFTAFGLGGCELLGTNDTTEEPAVTGVYVANQGNFSDANGSITVYDPDTQTVVQDAVPNIGSIIQSLLLWKGKGFIMANTANRVDVFDLDTHARTAQIEEVTSPRYMAIVNEGKAYVTNLFLADFTGGKVTIINPQTHEKIGEITEGIGNNPEGITIAGNRAYVANNGFGHGNSLSVINTSTDEVIDTITLEGCDGPRFLLTDAEEEVWAFCTGKVIYDDNWNVIGTTNGKVFVLNGATGAVVKTFNVNGRLISSGPGQDAYYAPESQEIFAVNGNQLLRFNTATNAQRASVTLPQEEASIGAVAYDGLTEQLYVGWVTGFTTAGWVGIYNTAGVEQSRFTAGIAPTYIAFRRSE